MSTMPETLKHPTSPRVWWILATVFVLWFGTALGVALGGILTRPETPPYLTALFAVAPIVVFVVAYRLSPRIRSWALGLDTTVLVGIHAWRMLGVSFLFLFYFDLLPAGFALPAGVGDAAAALGATWLTLAVARGTPLSRRVLVGWNLFGIADFLVAFTAGTLLGSQFFGGTVNTDAMAAFPLALIPLFIVPLLMITHIVIALQIRQGVTDSLLKTE